MPSVSDLLADDVRTKLVESLTADDVQEVAALKREGLPAEVLAHAIVIAPGEGKMTAVCLCGEEIEIDRTPPEGYEGQPRVPLCIDCAKTILAGRQGVVIRKPSVAKHQPRTTDGIDHPVTVTHTQEDQPVIDIDTLSDAELGKRVREHAQAKIADEMPAKAKKAKKAKRDKAKGEVKAKKREKAERAALDLPEFTVKGHTVPALDVSGVSSLDEVVSAKDRSAYNKARYRLGVKEVMPRETTWRDLVAEHQRLHKLALEAPAAKASKPAKASKGKVPPATKKGQVAVEVDLDARAVAAIMSARGVSEKKARKILASV